MELCLFKSMDWFIYKALPNIFISGVEIFCNNNKAYFGIQYIDQHVIDLVIHFQLVYLLIL